MPHGNPSGGGVGGGGGGGGPPMNDFIHGPQLSHPPDGPGGLLPQDKPLNHGMNDAVSRAKDLCIAKVSLMLEIRILLGLNFKFYASCSSAAKFLLSCTVA